MNKNVLPAKFEATWESLQQFQTPQWYLDGKFGIFIHWGVYSVPAFGNEWYPRNMYLQGTPEFEHHLKTYGSQARFGYKDFIPLFKAEKYNPSAWAELFDRAGAKFVVPVAEHHDGFAMYDSALSSWTAAKMGPQRDLIGELAQAVRQKGMRFGLSSHRAEHWFFMNGGRNFDSDVNDPRFADFYGPAAAYGPDLEWSSRDWVPRPHAKFLEDWLARGCELVDKYKPGLFWFDWWIEQTVFQPYLQRFASYYYNRGEQWQAGVAINYKHRSFAEGSAVLDIERGQLKDIRPFFWQNDTSISKNSWGYVKEQDYKTPASLIGDLVDVVSKNGALLLNVGPKPDGTIPEPEQEILLEIGRWLAVNGEAVYGTRPWQIFGEGPTEVFEGGFTDTKRKPFTSQDVRFTSKDGLLFAIILDWPVKEAVIRSLGADSPYPLDSIQRITLLGHPGTLTWRRESNGLFIQMPAQKPCAHAYVFKIQTGR